MGYVGYPARLREHHLNWNLVSRELLHLAAHKLCGYVCFAIGSLPAQSRILRPNQMIDGLPLALPGYGSSKGSVTGTDVGARATCVVSPAIMDTDIPQIVLRTA